MVDFYDPQTFLINVACAEMMAHYRIPHAGTSGSGEGWGPDLLAAGTAVDEPAHERLGKVGLAPFVGSSLNSKAFSPALTVYGDEVIGPSRLFGGASSWTRLPWARPRRSSSSRTDGHFLMTPTTLDRYRNAYYPSLFPQIGLEKWVEIGSPRADPWSASARSISSRTRRRPTTTTRFSESARFCSLLFDGAGGVKRARGGSPPPEVRARSLWL